MRLWIKLSLAGGVLLGTVLVGVYQASARLLADTAAQQLQQQAAQLAPPLSAALVAPLLQQDDATLQQVLDEMAAASQLLGLELRDAQGRLRGRAQPVGAVTGLAEADRGAAAVGVPGRCPAQAQAQLCLRAAVPLRAAGQALGELRYTLAAQALEPALAELRQHLLAVLAAALVLLAAGVALISRRLTAPLAELSRAAGRMAEGDYQAVLPPAGPDEVGRLSTHVATLREAIRDRMADLARARDAAEAANRAKSLFLANTSHELRTPLNGLLGMARLARQPDLEPERRNRYLELLVESGQNLADILNDTLDLAKVEAGRLTLNPAPFDPRALLQDALTTYRPLADAAGLSLVMQVEPEVPPRVLGDALRVRQILANYVSNALKFTERGSIRVVLARTAADRLRLSVHDSGPGISPALQARLFTPFTQGDDPLTRQHTGTGLGLAICRELATRMGGAVGVCGGRTDGPGGGTTFWAELELPPTDAEPGAEGPPADDEPEALRRLAGARVLVVEDNPINRVLAMALLEGWGAQPLPAFDGEQALAEVARAQEQGRPFHLVLMDLHMPVLDGLTATRALRKRWSADELPVIALTASVQPNDRHQALAAGMNDMVSKPIDTQRLRQLLVRLLPDPGPQAAHTPAHAPTARLG